MTNDHILGILSIYFAVAAVIVVVTVAPASGYEISVYEAYPVYFYIFVVAGLITSIFLLVLSCSRGTQSNWWIAGLLSWVSINSIILLLPVLRGYAFYGRTDPAQHYGFIKDIEITGHFNAPATRFENYYPASHIWVVSLSQITGLNSATIVMVTPVIFYLFYVMSVLIFSNIITKKIEEKLLIIAFSLPLSLSFIEAQFFPTTLTFFFSPLILYLMYQRGRQKIFGHALLSLLLILLLPFIHPGDTLLYLQLFLSLELAQRIHSKMTYNQRKHTVSYFLYSILVLFIAWFLWFSVFSQFGKTISGLFNWLISGQGISEAGIYFDILTRAHATFIDIVDAFLRNFGCALLLLLLAALIACNWLHRLTQLDKYRLSFLSVFAMFAILTPILVFIPAIGSWRRSLPYAILPSVFILGLGFGEWIRNNAGGKLKSFIVVILILMATLSISSIHPSPFTMSANPQISHHDILGMRWFLDHQNNQNFIDQQRVMQYALSAIILGNQRTPKNIRWGTSEQYQPPDHFGYDKHEMYGQSYSEDRYFLNDKLSRILLPTVFTKYKLYWRWNEIDWEKLNNDLSVLKVYFNGEFEVFYIKALSD
jgi:hypothetical protein